MAGGCLRDAYFGVGPAKDIDVFTGPDFDPKAFLKHAGPNWDISLTRDQAEVAAYDHAFGGDILMIYEATSYAAPPDVTFGFILQEPAGTPLQVCVRKTDPTLRGLFGDFDFSLNQIALVPGFKKTVAVTADFQDDARANRVTCQLDAEDPRIPYAQKRASRFAGTKYPGRRWLFPTKLEPYVQTVEGDWS